MTAMQTKPLAIEHRLLDWFKTDPLELARHDDPEKIRLQGEDMLAKGQLQAVGATEDGRMIFGHGRWLAAKSAGIKTLEVKIFPASISETEFKLIGASENLHRKELTGHKKWVLCSGLLSVNPTWQMKDLAEQLYLDPSMLTRLLSPSKCIPAWQEALASGKVGISDCYAASKLAEDEQAELLRQKLGGASRDAIEQSGRKKRNAATTAAVKLSRIKAMLPSGVVIVVSGKSLTLDDFIESLGEAQREAKKAREQGLDARTYQAVLRDKAKKK
jgi:ParB family transcriptional regulator, chromosome partitioning protein